jgi:hypothetical protein
MNARPGTDRPTHDARRQNGRIEVDVAARTITFRFNPLHD